VSLCGRGGRWVCGHPQMYHARDLSWLAFCAPQIPLGSAITRSSIPTSTLIALFLHLYVHTYITYTIHVHFRIHTVHTRVITQIICTLLRNTVRYMYNAQYTYTWYNYVIDLYTARRYLRALVTTVVILLT
jgi:hypothetical protein